MKILCLLLGHDWRRIRSFPNPNYGKTEMVVMSSGEAVDAPADIEGVDQSVAVLYQCRRCGEESVEPWPGDRGGA